jgi:hypothetical protein
MGSRELLACFHEHRPALLVQAARQAGARSVGRVGSMYVGSAKHKSCIGIAAWEAKGLSAAVGAPQPALGGGDEGGVRDAAGGEDRGEERCDTAGSPWSVT